MLVCGAVTAFTGIVLVLLGAFRLGGLARFLPYPVVSVYNAGSGWVSCWPDYRRHPRPARVWLVRPVRFRGPPAHRRRRRHGRVAARRGTRGSPLGEHPRRAPRRACRLHLMRMLSALAWRSWRAADGCWGRSPLGASGTPRTGRSPLSYRGGCQRPRAARAHHRAARRDDGDADRQRAGAGAAQAASPQSRGLRRRHRHHRGGAIRRPGVDPVRHEHPAGTENGGDLAWPGLRGRAVLRSGAAGRHRIFERRFPASWWARCSSPTAPTS